LLPLAARAPKVTNEILQRAIPSSAEKIPVLGLGTWQVFDVGASPNERAPLKEVLQRFVQLGGEGNR
jgi:aryl-alcohol dehydrogenase-like predicted oxidoreductase